MTQEGFCRVCDKWGFPKEPWTAVEMTKHLHSCHCCFYRYMGWDCGHNHAAIEALANV